jgi:hypothetical protein
MHPSVCGTIRRGEGDEAFPILKYKMLLIWMAEGTQRGKKTLRCFIYVLTSVGQLLEQGQVPIGEKEKKSMKITIYIHVVFIAEPKI